MSPSYSFVQVAVFTRQPSAGNPLAVFPQAEGMSDAVMQMVTREMNLSETTFVVPPTRPGADYRVRIFTPATPRPPSTRVHKEVEAGVLPIDLEFAGTGRLALVHTTQAKPEFQAPVQNRARVAQALGLTSEDLHPSLPIQLVSTGLGWLLVPLRNADALDRVQPNRPFFEGKDAVNHTFTRSRWSRARPGSSPKGEDFPSESSRLP